MIIIIKLSGDVAVDIHSFGSFTTSRLQMKYHYRVVHLVVNLGSVDLDLGVSPSCPTASAKLPSAQAELGRHGNNQNSSQPNPGSRPDGPPCTVTWSQVGVVWNTPSMFYKGQSIRDARQTLGKINGQGLALLA